MVEFAIAVLITAGLHVPVIPLLELEGSEGAEAFWHSGVIWVNVGIILAVITISIVVEDAHSAAFGVKL